MRAFWRPGGFTDQEGRPRRAGFEFEFGGVAVADAARAAAERLGGELREESAFRAELVGSRLGDVKIERDAHVLLSARHREVLAGLSVDFEPGGVALEVEKGVDKLAGVLVPCEMVTQPLLFEDFPKLDELVEVLGGLSAQGTGDSLLNAYGLHINPSAPALDAATLTAYIQAFLLLEDWIVDRARIDFTRRHLTSYIDPFPDAYARLVLGPDYAPDAAGLVDDYLRYNPTRNRSLDMLPLFCELDEDRVLAGLREEDRELVGPRPAFHYRLPDCRVGEEGWTVAREWNFWWHVEVLAADGEARDELAEAWRRREPEPLFGRSLWPDTVGAFLEGHFQPPGGGLG